MENVLAFEFFGNRGCFKGLDRRRFSGRYVAIVSDSMCSLGVADVYMQSRALKELALPRASHSGEIAPSGSRRLRSTLAVAPVVSHMLLSQ